MLGELSFQANLLQINKIALRIIYKNIFVIPIPTVRQAKLDWDIWQILTTQIVLNKRLNSSTRTCTQKALLIILRYIGFVFNSYINLSC